MRGSQRPSGDPEPSDSSSSSEDTSHMDSEDNNVGSRRVPRDDSEGDDEDEGENEHDGDGNYRNEDQEGHDDGEDLDYGEDFYGRIPGGYSSGAGNPSDDPDDEDSSDPSSGSDDMEEDSDAAPTLVVDQRESDRTLTAHKYLHMPSNPNRVWTQGQTRRQVNVRLLLWGYSAVL